MKRVQFVGLDVHADTIAVAVAEPGGTVRSVGVIPNRPESIRQSTRRPGAHRTRGRPRLPGGLADDNGPEFLAQPVIAWCADHRVAIHYIQPGEPDQNAYIERFNRSYGRLPLFPDHRMLDFRVLWKELPCGSHGSRRVRLLAS